MTSLKEKAEQLPSRPGVYLFRGKFGQVLYVGKAKNLKKRVTSYFTKSPDIKTAILLGNLYDIDHLVVKNELAALLLENDLIKKYKPRYNIALRDDKSYPMLKLTVNEKWPGLLMVRKKQKDKALYFGRFQGGVVREVIRQVKKLFPIRWCKESPLKMREQPCLYYRIGSCLGPCIGGVSNENYRQLVDGIISLLNGDLSLAKLRLEKHMKQASAAQDFELAAKLRDRLAWLEKMVEGKGSRRSGEAGPLAGVSRLAKVLPLALPPMRIEAFDVSNIQGSQVVASMVVFYGGIALKSDYRKFKIKTVEGEPNDVAAISEAVRRRYHATLAKEMPLPDLIVIDGGLGQVNAAKIALGLEIPIIGLAKKEETIVFPGRKKELKLVFRDPGLKLLQKIRDEAHRFAVSYHRKLRSRALFGH